MALYLHCSPKIKVSCKPYTVITIDQRILLSSPRMSGKVKKVHILRYGVIVSLIVVLSSCAFYLYLHYTSAEKTKTSIVKMISARENAALVDSCIIELYAADNSSRMYALSGKEAYFNQFTKQIKNVHKLIDTIALRGKTAGATAEAGELDLLVNEKSLKTDSYIRLMALTDSLLKSAERASIVQKKAAANVKPQQVIKLVKTAVKVDTIKTVAAAKPVDQQTKKKFFGRLLGGFKKPNDAPDQKAAEQQVILRHTTKTITIIRPAGPKAPVAGNLNYTRLFEANNRLRKSELDMLTVNNQLINQVIGNLKKYKDSEQRYIRISKAELNNNLTNILSESRQLIGIMFLLFTAVVAIILYNVWKIFMNEGELVTYTEKAETYAQAKSRFMANMSHEIRTPLNSIVGFAEQLNQSKLTEDQSEQVYAIGTSSKMLLNVVNEILDFSKYETGKMVFDNLPYSPYLAIDEITSSMRVQANSKGITLKRNIEFKKGLSFRGDFHRLKQVVMNLVGNAIKFTAKGQVTVQAYITQSDQADISLLNVQIKDTGVGIDKDHMPFIFDEFSQVKSAQKVTKTPGTGLGLAICKKIIELQGGSMKVVSTVGKGSIFSFKLPLQHAEAEVIAEPEMISPTEQYDLIAGRHILVADDNKLNVLLVTTILKKWNVTFDVAYDGRKALQLFEDNVYDILLTDIEMPEMGGIELSQVIRANGLDHKAQMPILALTANVLKEDTAKYLSVGMNGVVLKPFTEKNLIDTIAGVLSDRNMLVNN